MDRAATSFIPTVSVGGQAGTITETTAASRQDLNSVSASFGFACRALVFSEHRSNPVPVLWLVHILRHEISMQRLEPLMGHLDLPRCPEAVSVDFAKSINAPENATTSASSP